MSDIKQSMQSIKSKKGIAIAAGIAAVLIVSVFIAKGTFNGRNGSSETAPAGGDLKIPKSEITETAKFYPYNANGTKLEILAVKAGDGSIRTAFNTCQVCNGSPRAYYKQEGDVLVCQNCGNRFKMDMVEQQRGGCNPVPIMQGEKKDDGTNIVIPEKLIVNNKDLFTSNWKSE
ncbi:MAG TPA: DUF2318 domain-containing protein [Clostridia bacterium]|nr:DUF2318 domain-containing protein [Clostridia bacterium]